MTTITAAWSAGLLALVAVLFVQGADTAAKWASVLGALTALAGFTAPFVQRAVARASAHKATGAEQADQLAALHRAAKHLAIAVQNQWRDEARTRRLQDPWPLPLKWKAAEQDLADHPTVVFRDLRSGVGGTATGLDSLPGQLADVVDVYQQLPNRRLVVLGSPGSGKSVLALTLTLAILERWEPGAPVPVLFPLASWDPSLTDLDHWMVDYLAENYQLSGGENQDSRAVARALVTNNMLLPVLDGLDEIPQPLRSIGIKSLNRSLDQSQPIVLTSRTDEYRDAVDTGDVLTLAAVVQLQPLDLATISSYLTETTPAHRAHRWAPVFEQLSRQPAGALAIVLRTPLMVSLARTIYGDNPRDPTELLDPRFRDPSALEDHLLDELIPSVYDDHPRLAAERSGRWQTEDVTSWLTYLATHVGGPGRPDLAWWQLELAVPKVVIEAVNGLLGGLVVGLVFGPLAGVGFAIVATAMSTPARSGPRTIEAWLKGRLDRRHARAASPGRVVPLEFGFGETMPIERRLGLAVGRLAALGAGLIQGLLVFRSGDIFRATADGLALGLAVGLAAGFFTVSPRTTPSKLQFEGGKTVGVFLRHLTIGLAAGVGAGITAGALVGSRFGVLVGIVVGLAVGLIDGLNVWLDVSTDVTRALSPRSTRRADRIAALARSLTVGVTVGAPTSVAFAIAYGTRSALTHGLAFGVGFALADRLMGLGATVWGRYLVSNAWLALSGRLPWRLMAFLDDAHNHGLLRREGAAYQFRHARLQEHLATGRG